MSEPYENVEIRVFASRAGLRARDAQDESAIVDLVRNQVLPREKREYHSVRVKVNRQEDGTPAYLIAYLLRKDTYTADVVRVDVGEGYEVEAFVDDYDDSEEEEDDDGAPRAAAGAFETVDFVAATPVPEIPTAKQAVDALHTLALDAGLSSKKLLGPEATVANYKHYLSSGLRGFVNIGHGNPREIVLDDGRLGSTWFQGLAGKPVSPTVVYFNSCQVFNNPLQPSVMGAGARTFIGGIVNLRIGPSEEVCKCFWNKILASRTAMAPALHTCERDNYPSTGAHGISGDMNLFNFVTSAIAAYKVVLYGQDETGGDLVAFIHCYDQGQNVMTCEFYRDGSAIPKNRNAGGRVALTYPWSHFEAVLDVLRNEKPVYFGYIESTKVGYVATQNEPVGEGEEQP